METAPDTDIYDPIAADGEYLSPHHHEYMIRYLGQMSIPELDEYYAKYKAPHLEHLWTTKRLINLKPAVLEYIGHMDDEREAYLHGLPHTD